MEAGKIFAISFAINAALGGGFSAAMSGGVNAMRRLKEESGRVKMEQRQLDAAWRASQASIAAYRSRVSALTAQYQAGRISESQFRSGVRIAAQTMQSASMSASEYRANLQRLQGEMQRTQAAMQQMNAARAARASASTRLSDANAGMMGTVSTAAVFAAPLIGAVETAANFEAAMSKVQAITRSNSSEMQALTENARILGETTQFSATQAADAMSYLGMAGWNANQIIAGMPGLLALAAAGGTDLARTADIVSDDLTAFGLSADQAGHMADVFAVTVTRTNTNVEMLGETMKYAAPVAKAFGASMEETAALAGLMANSGIKASQAGTALRSGFLRLAGPPKQATKAMQELGMSMSDITAQQQETKTALESLGISMSDTNGPRKMSAILTELRDKTADLGQEEKLATLKMIFGTEAATGWLAVLDAGPETFNDLVDQMENCDGEAQKMAETMMNNAKGALIQLKSSMEGLGISVGNVFLPALTTAMKGMSSMAAAASGWVKAHEGIVAGLGSIGAAAAGLMVGARGVQILAAVYGYARSEAMGLYLAMKNNVIAQGLFKTATEGAGRALTAIRPLLQAGALQTAGAAFRALGTAILSVGRASVAAMFSPLGIALMAIAGAAYLIYSNWSMVGPFFMGLWNQITAAFSNAWMMIQPALANLQMVFGQLVAVLGPQLAALGATIVSAFATIGEAVAANSGALNTLLSAIGAVAQVLGGVLIGEFIVFAEVAVGAVTMAVNVIASIITGLIGIISGVVAAITGVLAGDWSAAWDGASNAVSAAFNAMAGIASAVGSTIVGTVQNIISSVKSAASAVAGLDSGGGGGKAAEVGSNARGGIYRKGAFLTTFAEESDEAAIPLDGSARAIGLWRMAGRILGVGGETEKHAAGSANYQDTPPYARTVSRLEPKAPRTVTRAAVEEYRPSDPPTMDVIRASGQHTAHRADEVREYHGNGGIEPPPLNITLNFYGQEEPHRVRQAVLDAGRKVQKSFAEQMETYKRERGRLAFE
nr:phage tail tape measure protein [Mitsuokella multacida]